MALLLAAGLAGAPAAAAPTYVTYTLTPSADTFVQSNTATTNYGGNTALDVRLHSTGERRAAYRFDFSSVPPGTRLVSATLALTVTAALGEPVGVYAIGFSGWTEYGATWTNTGGFNPGATQLASLTPATTGQTHSLTLTSVVSGWLAGTTPNNGVLLRVTGNTSNVSGQFASKEWGTVSQRPQLALTMLPPPALSLVRSSTVVSDPHRGAANPKRIPGAVLSHTLTVESQNSGYPDTDTVVLAEPVPSGTSLYVGDLGAAGSGPVAFAQGTPTSGLSFTYAGLASTTDDLAFSNDGGVSYAYVPVPDGSGYDSLVTHVRVSLKGTFAGESGAGYPKFTLTTRSKVR